MKTLIFLVASVSFSANASIADFKQFTIDFTNQADAINKSTWSEADKINSTKSGLGWDGEPAASRDGWVLTQPYAIGFSWRPTTSASIKAAVQPSSRPFKLPNGSTSQPWRGQIYVRYSSDYKNWSSWQVLQADDKLFREKQQIVFQGLIQVPNFDRQEYCTLLSEYSRMDVPWGSDEDAAVRWIVSHDKKFFEKHIPFIGYIQFLYETDFRGGQRITGFSADIFYGISGMAMVPKEKSKQADMQKSWQYKATENAQQDAAANP